MKLNKLYFTIITYLISIILIIYLKPSMIFNKDGKLKLFGINNGQTIYPLWIVVSIVAILSYYFVTLLFFFKE